VTWKSNCFLETILSLNNYPTCLLHCGSRQSEHQAGAVELHVPLEGYGGADGRADHVEGHLKTTQLWRNWNTSFVFTKENLIEVREMLMAKRCQLLPLKLPLAHVKSLCQPKTLASDTTTKISRGTIGLLGDVQLIETGGKISSRCLTIYNPHVLPSQSTTEGVCNVASVCLQAGLALSVKAEYIFPLAEEDKSPLVDPAAFVAAAPLLAATTDAAAPAK
ncbi:60S acidic ribosomal protein P0, partial [Galemys pyrenaicus]